ncbi:NFYB/HAP3 family transcription factor subunit [Candidatus Bathyarchaeota archaeon]|nr:NFYB/HAP3 family transcription factor subunit [Candidatus Bathyarchaeota archaeon]
MHDIELKNEKSKNYALVPERFASIKYSSKRKEEIEGNRMPDEIKVAPMHKLIKKAGAERVSEESAVALGIALEEIGVKVAREAIDYARHAGRKTVKARDIEIAAKKVLER